MLLGFKGGDSTSTLSDVLKTEYLKRDVVAAIDIRHSLKGVSDYLASNIDTNILIIQEQFGERSTSLDISFFDEITDLYSKLVVIAILTNERKGTDYVVNLMTHNCYNCLYEKDAQPKNIVKVSLDPRNKNDAKAYYSIRDRGLNDSIGMSMEPSTTRLTSEMAGQIIESLKGATEVIGPYSAVSIFEKASCYISDEDLKQFIVMLDDEICSKLAGSSVFLKYGGKVSQRTFLEISDHGKLHNGDSRATITKASLNFSEKVDSPSEPVRGADKKPEPVYMTESQNSSTNKKETNDNGFSTEETSNDEGRETGFGISKTISNLVGRFHSSDDDATEERSEPKRLVETLLRKPNVISEDRGSISEETIYARHPIEDPPKPIIQRFENVSAGGLRIIAVGSVERGTGCTHTAVSMASLLKRMGYRVLMVEACSHAMLHRLHEKREFRSEGIDIYIATNSDGSKDYSDCFSRNLDFLVIDVGAIKDRHKVGGGMSAFEEMQRAQLAILTADASPWRFKEAEVIGLSNDIPRGWSLLYSPTSLKMQKRIRNEMNSCFTSVHFSEFSPDAFCPSESQDKILGELISSIVGGKKKKGLFGR